MKNQREFFSQLFASANPGWHTQLGPKNESGVLGDCETFIYMVDLKTGWISAAATRTTEFMAMKKQLSDFSAKVQIPRGLLAGAAAHTLLDASSNNASHNSDAVIKAVTGVSFALADTRTYDIVLEKTGEVKGHWLYMMYTMADGGHVGRPVYTSGERGHFLETDKLNYLIKVAIEQDKSPSSSVGRMIQEGGGTTLHHTFIAEEPDAVNDHHNPGPQG